MMLCTRMSRSLAGHRVEGHHNGPRGAVGSCFGGPRTTQLEADTRLMMATARPVPGFPGPAEHRGPPSVDRPPAPGRVTGYLTISRMAIMPASSWLRMWQWKTVFPV